MGFVTDKSGLSRGWFSSGVATYLLTQEGRARRGEISAARPKNSVPSSKALYTAMQVQDRYIVSATNAGAAIRNGDGRTAQDATSATAFVKVRPT